ncbi:hypothetical protein D915_010909 [Fasciola hepatica]|uniref:HEAT repeat protein n=1 Tax=Fasciola hepatica TaxID=6192 RepID=A0A4E0R8J5_FASHE|nr:hypothetical protein D915_010909 [Fasciola hepatica]
MHDQKSTDISSSEPTSVDSTEALLISLEHLRVPSRPLQSTECLELRRAFSSRSAHVRCKAIDVLGLRAGPKLWLGTVLAGELVLWHTQDSDARVRDRSFHCLLSWTATSRDGSAFAELHGSLKAERIGWIQSNLESVYLAACHGLSDVEEMVSFWLSWPCSFCSLSVFSKSCYPQ